MRFSIGSDYHGFGLQSTTAIISTSGSSDADVWVDGELTANASGGSPTRAAATTTSGTYGEARGPGRGT